ncbi:MAG: c-type cytochrome [Gammaproteobacteria bacterium]|nr:c-type cytochrome [Gammaproteobacteria bacterium]
MSEAHADTFSPKNITVLVGLLLVAVIIGEVLIGPHSDEPAMAQPMDTREDIAMRLKPVISLDEMRSNMTVASAAGDSADKSPEQLYQAACLACHNTGAAGAPKIGDAAGWKPRIAKGLDALVSSALIGIGAMPPRGGSQYSDDQIRSVVEYILAESR